MAHRSSFKIDQYNKMLGLKYKTKYRRLKKIVKNYIFENSALCDQIAQIQENIITIKEERRFLLTKLIEYEHENISQGIEGSAITKHIEQNSGATKKIYKRKSSIDSNSKIKVNGNSKLAMPIKKPLYLVDLDGSPAYPINFGNLTIQSLGDIIENPNFHTANWIYPVGYMATRVYSHPKEPERKCTFTCKILDNSGIPQFQIIPDSDFDHVFFGETANVCHLGLLETIVRVSNVKNLPIQQKGELFFGLGNPTVMSLLQSSPNSKKCLNFKGFTSDINYGTEKDNDPTLNYDALQTLIAMTAYHTVPEIKEEPPEKLLE